MVGDHVQARVASGGPGDAREVVVAGAAVDGASRASGRVLGGDRWGRSSEDAVAEVGMSSAFGARSFREAGGMPPLKLIPLSGRYLLFEEREEIGLAIRRRTRLWFVRRPRRASPAVMRGSP